MQFKDPWGQKMAAVDRAHTELCAAQANLLQAVTDLEQFEGAPDDPEIVALGTQLAARYGESPGTTDEWVRVGRALRDLPAIGAAHREGHLSWGQVRPLSRFATPETEEALSVSAQHERPSKLWRQAHRNQRAENQKTAQSDHQSRRVWMRWDQDRTFLELYAELPAEQGARVERALVRRAEDVVLEEDPPPFDRGGARLADALVDLVTSSGNRASTDTLVLHADARVLWGGNDPGLLGETDSGIQMTDEAIRRLACDSRVEWVAERDGRAVGIGRQSRVVPGWMRRQLEHRDPECRFEGCGRKKWLVIHHLIPWARGGPTNFNTLIRVCSFHHRQLHEGGWTVTGQPDHRLRFHDPGGRVLGRRNPVPKRDVEPTLGSWNGGSTGWRTSTE